MLVGIDIGGTFTDIVAFDPQSRRVAFEKVLTTHGDLSAGVMNSLRAVALDLDRIESIRHGTTVVINTLLERSGGPTALITNTGFRDVLEIGRGNRPIMFDLFYRRHAPLVPRHLRFEIDELLPDRRTVRDHGLHISRYPDALVQRKFDPHAVRGEIQLPNPADRGSAVADFGVVEDAPTGGRIHRHHVGAIP